MYGTFGGGSFFLVLSEAVIDGFSSKERSLCTVFYGAMGYRA
jgi:hypothetical protein